MGTSSEPRSSLKKLLIAGGVLLFSSVATVFVLGERDFGVFDGSHTDCGETASLQQRIDDAPDGATIELSGTLCLDKRITIASKRGLTLDGQESAVLRQAGSATDKMFVVEESEDIRFTRLEIVGASPSAGNGPGAYSEETAQAAAIAVKGSSGVTIEDTYIHDVYGDFVDLDRGRKGTFTSDVRIVGNRLERNGRQAVSLGTNVKDVVISGNQVVNVRRSVFDLEPPVEDALVQNVQILDNDIENFRNYVVAVGPKGVVRDVVVKDNEIQSPGGENTGRGMVHVPFRGEKTPPLSGLVVCGNTGDFAGDNNFKGAVDPVTTCAGQGLQQ